MQQYPLPSSRHPPINPHLSNQHAASEDCDVHYRKEQPPPPPPPAPPQLSVLLTSTAVTPPPRVRRISVRPLLFKLAVGGLMLAVLLCATRRGICWILECSRIRGRILFGSNDLMFLEMVVLMWLLTALGVEIYQDFLSCPPPRENKAVEILAAVGGVLGLAEIVIYFIVDESSKRYVTWDFWLGPLGSVLALLSAVLVAVMRVRSAAQTNQALTELGVACTRHNTRFHGQIVVASNPNAYPMTSADAIPLMTYVAPPPSGIVTSAAPAPVTPAPS